MCIVKYVETINFTMKHYHKNVFFTNVFVIKTPTAQVFLEKINHVNDL